MSRYPHFRLPNLDTNTFVNETAQCSYIGPCGFGYEQLSQQKICQWPMNNSKFGPVTNLLGIIHAPIGYQANAIVQGDGPDKRLGYKIYLLAFHFRGYYKSSSLDGDIVGVTVFWDHQSYLGSPNVSDIIAPSIVPPFIPYYSTTTFQRPDTFGRYELLYRYVNNVTGASITDLFSDPEYVDFVVPLLGRTISYNKDTGNSNDGNLLIIFQTETAAATWTTGGLTFFSDTPYDNPP